MADLSSHMTYRKRLSLVAVTGLMHPSRFKKSGQRRSSLFQFSSSNIHLSESKETKNDRGKERRSSDQALRKKDVNGVMKTNKDASSGLKPSSVSRWYNVKNVKKRSIPSLGKSITLVGTIKYIHQRCGR